MPAIDHNEHPDHTNCFTCGAKPSENDLNQFKLLQKYIRKEMTEDEIREFEGWTDEEWTFLKSKEKKDE